MVQIHFILQRADYDGIIDMAGYGIKYWASYMCSEDDGCHFTDPEHGDERESKDFFITPADVEQAIAQLFLKRSLNGYYMSAIDRLVLKGDSSEIGSDIADAIIQQACFGEVIYG
tara:strand:- start:794 stop:1138 length:345 start_codon:yes stop_codon:yes gene_type:complete